MRKTVTVCDESSYDPTEYWLKRGITYMAKFEKNKKFELQEKILVDYLHTLNFSNVLELGCGFGRISKILLSKFPKINKYVGVDLSPHQIENAREYTKTLRTSADVQFVVSEIQNFHSDERFDLILASEVLLHVLPGQIRAVMERMVSLSLKHIINIDWYTKNPPDKIANHNFLHQYEAIYKSMPLVNEVYKIPIKKIGLDTKQCIFCAKVA